MQNLKYPDQDLVRWFFKTGLHTRKPLNVIEFGCGCGNNLKLFAEYGHNITGLDIDKDNIDFCKKTIKGNWMCNDMYSYFQSSGFIHNFDVIIFASSLYYLEPAKIEYIFKKLKAKDGTKIFLKMRQYGDYRHDKILQKSGIINFPETGEQGCINTFYSLNEIRELLKNYDVKDEVFLYSDWENLMNGITVHNADIIYWGSICQKTSA